MLIKLIWPTTLVLILLITACRQNPAPPATPSSVAVTLASSTLLPPETQATIAPKPTSTVTTAADAPLPSPSSTVTSDNTLSNSNEQIDNNVIVTYDNNTMPSGCGPREVAYIIMAFLDAINSGDQAQLARFFDDDFMWYVVAELTIRVRSQLPSYFAERFQQQERFQLVMMDVDYEPSRRLVHTGYILTRQANDLGEPGDPPFIVHGKGALNCEDGQGIIVVWSMGPPLRDEPDIPFRPCPDPPTNTPTGTVAVCTRGWQSG